MEKNLVVATASKDTTFQMRMNSEIKAELEETYARAGLSLTDAINVFFQQSLNIGGLPFFVAQDPDCNKRLMTYMEKIYNRKKE